SRLPGSPYDAVFVPQLNDPASVTLLGPTGGLDLDGALDVVLARPRSFSRGSSTALAFGSPEVVLT
ncbi:MAG: hypothetical protein ACXW2Y_08410, partial [Acidimicrobiia bacterium]